MKIMGSGFRKFLAGLSAFILIFTIVGIPLAVIIVQLETLCEKAEEK